MPAFLSLMSLRVSWLTDSRVLRLPSVTPGTLRATSGAHVLKEEWLAFLCVVISWRDFSAAIRVFRALVSPMASLLH